MHLSGKLPRPRNTNSSFKECAMSRCLRLLLACVVFSLLPPPRVPQAPPIADPYVTRATPATNYGSGPILAVQDGTTTYLQFDLSALPEGASIDRKSTRLN